MTTIFYGFISLSIVRNYSRLHETIIKFEEWGVLYEYYEGRNLVREKEKSCARFWYMSCSSFALAIGLTRFWLLCMYVISLNRMEVAVSE